MKRVAVLLCGSGYRDGSEIRESVGALWALSAEGASVQCFAPNAPQADVVNCLTGQTAHESRNMLVEAARIARGQVKPASEFHAKDFDALVIPGGFGVAKNLCTFALKGSGGTVQKDAEFILTSMFDAKKPIAAICIAPALVALALKGRAKLELTVGEAGEAAQEIEKLGHRHFVTRPNQAHVDRAHKVVTTPAYMYDSAPLNEIFEGIRSAVHQALALA